MSIAHVILLIIDDVRYDQFFSLMESKHLPNIGKLKKNSFWGKSITTFPSATVPAHITIMTGEYQDNYKIPLMNYYDRINRKFKNYSNNLKAFDLFKDMGEINTLFDMLSEKNTCNVYEPVHRGASYNYPSKFKAIIKYIYYRFFSDLNKSNENVVKRIIKVFKNPKRFFNHESSITPILTVAWFPATDLIMHNFGSESKEYLTALQSVDSAIGQLVNELKELNHLKDTAIVIVSDHGNYSAKELYNPQPFLASKGLLPLTKKKGDYDMADGSVLGFYFSGDDNTHFKTKSSLQRYKDQFNVIEIIKELKGIKWLAYRKDKNTLLKGTIEITRKINNQWKRGYIHYKNNKTRYEIEDEDILGYYRGKKKPDWLDHSKYYSLDEWLSFTHDLDFPIFPDQILRNFLNPNSCDLFASSMAEIVYNSVHGTVKKNFHVHAHDVALKCSMQVPLLIYHKDFKEKNFKYSKTSDIVPTILTLLDKHIPRSLPGKSII
ncbi:MAG: sulfatase-like hydrolase/transferase [Candidatus Lokiarchaeota archaeon]|nr:sulfatase-like hydrolase/transferase [Candidatus Lokiarchaeota archaeon]